jgi:2,3-bisphosphoglycerate-dependent phosphoglycerate mutase
MAKLILMRHGQSAWNAKNLFTGWVDIPLSKKGVQEAIDGGKKISSIPIDLIYTSTLVRAHMTLALAMLQHESGKIPVFQHRGQEKLDTWSQIYSDATKANTLPVIMAWELNERMYGELQGKNKAEMAEEYGAEQVHIWRRSFDTPPPEGESLSMTSERTLPYFKNEIVPALENGQNVFVCAHGNSLRAIVMHLDSLSKEEVLKLELPTGESLIYDFEDGRHERLSR